MKKVLYGTSAIVAASLVSGAAFAEAPELSISGASDWAYVVSDQDGPGNGDGVDGDSLNIGNSSTQLIFGAEGTADNGLTYGARIDWRTGNDSLDEHYVYFEGGWGTLHVGGDDGVIDNNVPGGESVTAGDFLWDGNNQAGVGGAGTASTAATLASGTDDRAKFSYYSPSFSGFSVGASYVPDTTAAANFGMQAGLDNATATGAGGNGAQYEGTVRYDGNFGDASFAIGLGYAHGEGGDSFDDREGLMAGATVGIAGFNVGVGYGDNFDTNCGTGVVGCDAGGWWNIAANYGFGAATVYAGYMASEATPSTAAGEDETDQFGFGVDYALAEGLKTYAEYLHVESDDASANTDAESDSIILGTTISY